MKILSTEQLKALDMFTIAHEPVSSEELMERAARACVKRLIKLAAPDEHILVVCGKGNNGGDGLAITRLLNDLGFSAEALLIEYSTNFSKDSEANYHKLSDKYPGKVTCLRTIEELTEKTQQKEALLVDALLGTGANKPAEGFLKEVILYLNAHFRRIISIDMPSGLFADKSSSEATVIRSSLTLSFQFPKLAFLLADNRNYVPEFEILDIGLHPEGIATQDTSLHYITKQEIRALLKSRSKFQHKGNFGHALLLAGSRGKSGAAIISAKACLRSGAGLLTVHSTSDTLAALLHHLPEAMTSADAQSGHISEVHAPETYDAIGFGPGTGSYEDTQAVLKKLLHYYQGKLILDADGLNILSENKTWLSFLPPDTILTPHPKEFERLTEKHNDDFDRLDAARKFSLKYNCILVLKGAHTAIAMPDGNVFFNSSGNPGLAKGGSGDGLTGIILGLLSRGYTPPQAALIGTFLHGFSADLCTKKKSRESLLISDVTAQLPKAFKKLETGT